MLCISDDQEDNLLASSYLGVLLLSRGTTAVDGAGFGIDRPAELSKEDDEYEAFRKRMMLAYRFRPNPLVMWLPKHPRPLDTVHVPKLGRGVPSILPF